MTWRIGDHGFEMTLSPVYRSCLPALGIMVKDWLATPAGSLAGFRSLGDPSWRAANLTSVAKALQLPERPIAPSAEIWLSAATCRRLRLSSFSNDCNSKERGCPV